MTQAQKVIKYLAIALALFLIVQIFVGLYAGVSAIIGIHDSSRNSTEDSRNATFEGDIKILKMDLSAANLTICRGDTLTLETTCKRLTWKQEGTTLTLKEKRRSWFSPGTSGDIVLTIPDSTSLKTVSINAGAGTVSIAQLVTEVLDLDLGAGEVTLQALSVTQRTTIDGGAGTISITDSSLTSLDLDMGVGDLLLAARLIGTGDLDFGVGEAELRLTGTEEDYQIKLDKGLGKATLNGQSISSDTVYGSGPNVLKLDVGIGSIHILFDEE